MNRYFIVLLFVMYCNSVFSQQNKDGNGLTLEEVWTATDSNNKKLKMAGFSRQQAEVAVEVAKDRRIPSVTALGNVGVNTDLPVYNNGFLASHDNFPVSRYTYSLGYQMELNVYSGGRENINIKISKEELLRNKNEYELQRNNIRYAAAVAYYDLHKFIQFLRFTTSEIVTEKKQMATIESLFKNGTVLKSDVLRVNVKLSQLELARSDIEKKISIAKERLNILMGRNSSEEISIPMEEAIDVEAFTENPDDNHYVDMALKQSPDFKMYENEYEISNLLLKQVKSELMPKVSLYSGYNLTYPQSSFFPYSTNLWGFGQTGVRVSFSLDKLYTNRHAAEQARFQTLQQEKKMEVMKDDLTIEIKEAYLQKMQAFETVRTAEENIRQATETVRIIRNSYMNQESLLTDLLEAENMLLEAKFALTSAHIDVVISHIRLLVKTGII
ncbi:TolC family protein [Epilithonimonas hungarica]|uniref:Outer membrane protein TolC n=1 Tax=Epilithonimonas hungarica TaxID=454006 RepID=A0A1G7SS88_9FLAO|nr:TolC family protein [Epilithonimonas hungarica]SDG25883.1 Outer membrane protein TolC [Epilithonimonas hungarica]